MTKTKSQKKINSDRQRRLFAAEVTEKWEAKQKETKIAAQENNAAAPVKKIKMPKFPVFTREQYLRDDDSPPPVVRMTIEQWAQIPRNPFQKEKRSKRKNIKYLFKFIKENADARMGIYPDGTRCKIDCHTRGELYLERPHLVDHPPQFLNVYCYPVRDDAHAAERFKSYDNKKAAKNAADDVHGALRLYGVPTTSTFFQNASNIKTPLQYAYALVAASTDPADALPAAHNATTDDYVTLFKDALIALDDINVSITRLKTPFITAFLLAYTKHGPDIVPFFVKVNEGNHGRKLGAKMCPIAAVEQARDKWRGGGQDDHMSLTVQVLGALDTYIASPKFREPDYQPKIKMQKIMTIDPKKYLLQEKAKRTGRTKKFTR